MEVVQEDFGEGSMQCTDHPYTKNTTPGGICPLCLQEKLGKLVSSSFPIPVFPSSSSSSSASFRSESPLSPSPPPPSRTTAMRPRRHQTPEMVATTTIISSIPRGPACFSSSLRGRRKRTSRWWRLPRIRPALFSREASLPLFIQGRDPISSKEQQETRTSQSSGERAEVRVRTVAGRKER